MSGNARVLITGGAGFIGAFLARALAARGETVHLLDDLSRGRRDRFLAELLAGGRVALFERRLAQPGALDDLPQDYARIFHLAAVVGVSNVVERPFDTLRDNALGLLAALELAARQRALERFVFASTSEVHAAAVEAARAPVPTPEEAPLELPALDRPRSAYALSKLYGEALVRHAGVPFTILRPHNVYGPRMGLSHVVPQLLEKAHRAPEGGSLEVFSPDHRRSFCFVDDAVELIVRAGEREACRGQVLNVGAPGPELSMSELAGIVIGAVGKKLRIAPGPVTPGSPPRRCPDTTRATALTGYTARVAPEEGVRRTWAWYRPFVFEGGEGESAR